MKFYVLQDANGTTVDCQLTIQRCRDAAEAQALHEYEIHLVDVDVSAESMRKMLAGQGGYANDTKLVRTTVSMPSQFSARRAVSR